MVLIIASPLLVSLPNFQPVPTAYAAGPPVLQNMTLIDAESFEGSWPPTGWSETGQWNKENNEAYDGIYSADFNGTRFTTRSGDLTTPNLDCSDANAIYVDFWYRDDGLDVDDLLLKYYDGSNWDTISDLGSTTQEDQWLHYQQKITDSQYFVSTFKMRWSAVTVGNQEHAYVDVVTVKKEIMAPDTPPVWSNAGTNSTVAGEPTLFHVKWTDDVGLSGFIFGTNNTGAWVNDTWAPMSGTTDWSDITKILNSAVGATVWWRVWANDTSNNWGDTGTFSLTTTRAVITQLGLCFDGSSSISSSEFAIIKAGIAAAVRNASQMPHDGTVELTVVQFGTGITAYARVEVAPTVVTSANFESIATTIEGIGQIGGYTPTADGLLFTWLQMKGSPNFAIATRQVINVASNGFANRALKATPPVGWPTPPGTPWGDVAYVRDNAAAEGLDEIDAEGIGVTPQSLADMRDYLVYPQPGTIAPPYDPGWVRWVANATEFAAAVGEKFITVLQQPVACFTVSNDHPNVCETVTFNATCSYDPDGWIVNYTWNFGDSNITVAGAIITHHYGTFGNYTATLTVTDNDGLTDSTSKLIWVREHPVARFTYSPSYPQVCEVVVFNASASTPDGGTIISYEWNFGDGNTTIIGDDEPITPIITHHYTAPGDYNVTLTVTDSENKSDTTWKMITVTPLKYYLTVKTDPLGLSPAPTPTSNWYDNCTYVNLTAPEYANVTADTRYRFDYWDVNGTPQGAGVNNITVHMDANYTATAHYVLQYLVTFDQTGLDATATGTVVTVNGNPKTFSDLPYTTWIDSGDSISYSYSDPVSSSVGGKRFKLVDVTGPTSPITVTSPVTVTGNYKIQYEVTFDQSGVGTDFTGTVVTIDASGYTVTDLPVSFWWDENSGHSFSFASPLIVNASKQYIWISTSGLSSLQSDTLTITGSGSVVGNYSTGVKYQITFDQTGVGSDFTGTVVVIDGTNYNKAALPVSFLWDAGSSHNFSFQSPLVVTANAKRYVWNSTSGLLSLQSGSITVSTSGSIIGNYKTQYYLTVISPYDTPGGGGWYYSSTDAHATLATGTVDHGNGTRRQFTQWSGDASGTTLTSNPIHMDGPKTAIANWKTQYYLTVSSAHGTTGGEGWYDASDTAYATVTPLTVSGPAGVRYVFTKWSGDASGNTSPSNPITMDGPKTAVASWKTQYYLTVRTDPSGLSPAPGGEGWYDAGTNVKLTAPDPSYEDSVEYSFKYWKVNGTPMGVGVLQITVSIDKPYTATAYYYRPEIKPVGGHIAPIRIAEEPSLQTFQIGLVSVFLAAIAIVTILIRRKSKMVMKIPKTR